MAAGVTGEVRFSIQAALTGSTDLGSPKMTLNPVSEVLQLEAGTAVVNQANILFADTRTLAASATEDLDLSGVLADAFGASIVAAEVVAIYVKAASANVNNVNVSRPATNGFVGPFLATGDGVAVKPGEHFAATSRSGWAVTAATGDLLTVANSGSGTAVTYDIVIIGRTVAA